MTAPRGTSDRTWTDEFVMRRRMLDVPGRQIGDELKVVEAHCAEAGESRFEAFGDPVDYAFSLGKPRMAVGQMIFLVLFSYLALMFLGNGLFNLGDGTVDISMGDVVAASIAVAGAFVAFAMYRIVRSQVVIWSIFLVAAVVVGPLIRLVLPREPLVTMSAWVSAVIGAVLLLVVGGYAVGRARRDRIVDPVTGNRMP